jgi:hypothetical protein
MSIEVFHDGLFFQSLQLKAMSSGFMLVFTLALGVVLVKWQDDRKLSHIPILGAELGKKGRTKEFRLNAKSFLRQGYEQVRGRIVYDQNISHEIPSSTKMTKHSRFKSQKVGILYLVHAILKRSTR